MDALRHFGAGGVDAYRQARQQPGGPGALPSMTVRDPGGRGFVVVVVVVVGGGGGMCGGGVEGGCMVGGWGGG